MSIRTSEILPPVEDVVQVFHWTDGNDFSEGLKVSLDLLERMTTAQGS